MALTDKLSAIGDAIREKTGNTALLTLDAMPAQIRAIQTGGGSSDSEEQLIKVLDRTIDWFNNDNITTIGDGAFDSSKLIIINLPSTLTHIGNESFYKSSISEITLPENVVYIGRNALNTSRISKITFELLSSWGSDDGTFSAESLSDPVKNVEFFTDKVTGDDIWMRND